MKDTSVNAGGTSGAVRKDDLATLPLTPSMTNTACGMIRSMCIDIHKSKHSNRGKACGRKGKEASRRVLLGQLNGESASLAAIASQMFCFFVCGFECMDGCRRR